MRTDARPCVGVERRRGKLRHSRRDMGGVAIEAAAGRPPGLELAMRIAEHRDEAVGDGDFAPVGALEFREPRLGHISPYAQDIGKIGDGDRGWHGGTR